MKIKAQNKLLKKNKLEKVKLFFFIFWWNDPKSYVKWDNLTAEQIA